MLAVVGVSPFLHGDSRKATAVVGRPSSLHGGLYPVTFWTFAAGCDVHTV